MKETITNKCKLSIVNKMNLAIPLTKFTIVVNWKRISVFFSQYKAIFLC